MNDRPLEEVLPDDAPRVELLVSLRIAMDSLPPVDRRILQARMDGKKYQEIARGLHCTRANVQWHLKRTRRYLAERLILCDE